MNIIEYEKSKHRNERTKQKFKPEFEFDRVKNHIYSDEPQENKQKTVLGIRGRLFVGFSMIAIILFLAIAGILYKVSATESYATSVVKIEMPTHDASYDLQAQIYISLSSIQNYILMRDDRFKKEFNATWAHIDSLMLSMDEYSKSWASSEFVRDWQELKVELLQLKEVQNKIFATANTANQAEMVSVLTNEILPRINKTLDTLDGPLNSEGKRIGGMFDYQSKILKSGSEKILSDVDVIRIIGIGLLITTVIMSIVIAVFTAHKIVPPLKYAISVAKRIARGERHASIKILRNDEVGELLASLAIMQDSIKENENKLKETEAQTRVLFENIVQTAEIFSEHSSRVAAGDLTQRLKLDKEDVMAKLGKDLNTMTEGLANVSRQITQSCNDMVVTIEEVKQAVDVQASGASEQASSINEITASLEEIEKSSMQTIEKAKTLGEVAERTRAKGQQGLDAVEQSINGMRAVREKVQTIAQTILELSHQTQQVGEITAVVNTLAQQSKMLALNASIEAAKAGEAGKGFAVVASEVKNLAEQSEQSTSQVQKILEDIRHATEKAVMATEEGTKGVDQGTGLVEQTGDVVRSLSDVIHETTIASQQIEAAIRQEGIGIEQITAGMNEINQVTASFVASVKQTTEAIEHLAGISRNLKKYVEIYKL